ncbi:hypothetical protein BDZ97DRAFT_1856552 [Flammula alnicola]|nr:hypothetical protein BDZ97DRAFT_1856552 [Flammula alnicola]
MEFNIIPDDVWIEIFESVDDPAQLAVLVRTCRRFRDLASKPLLRELKWGKMESTERNIEAWQGVYKDMVTLPRKLTLSVAFDFTNARSHMQPLTPEMSLHDSIHLQIPSFTSLHELVLDSTAISPYTYSVLALVPTLRSLSLINCSYYGLPTAFKDYRNFLLNSDPQNPLNIQFADLPITHLSLHKVTIPQEHDYQAFHPLNLITASNLTSLSITWTGGLAVTYAPKKWLLPQLTQLDVVMPLLTRDLVDSLVSFSQNCPLGPSINLCIERHNLSDQQISAVQLPLKGVCSYTGPLPIASFAAPRQRSNPDSCSSSLKHLVMNEPLDLGGLLDGLEKLPNRLETLEIEVRKWDVELLFAIRHLFPHIRSLIIRYGKGTFPPDFFVTLGANILFDLPKLHTIKLLQDTSCIVTNRQLSNLHHFGGHVPVTFGFEEEEHEHEVSRLSPSLEEAELKDYLIGWNRYCKCLRNVQLNSRTRWERKFEGDRWVEVPSTD